MTRPSIGVSFRSEAGTGRVIEPRLRSRPREFKDTPNNNRYDYDLAGVRGLIV